ncbi:MAG: hypothetical protein U9Q98_10340 [Bacteroidota bacterium]|nr:hypothetical protein [Bacteroidota bacterium]
MKKELTAPIWDKEYSKRRYTRKPMQAIDERMSPKHRQHAGR